MAWPSPELRAELLAATLEYCAEHVPFYRALRGGPAPALDDFPLVDRDVVADHLAEMVVVDRFPDYLVSSGGTTGGRPNVSFRNDEEYEAAHEYLTGLRPGEVPDLASIREFAIDLFFNTNGHHWRKPRGWPVVCLVLEQPAHAEVLRTLIADGLELGGRRLPAGRLQSQNGPLRTVTGWFWATGFDPSAHSLRSVHGYGSHLSRTWRARLAELWGAQVLTSYGLMEFGVGGAALCSACGGYHYRTAWPEFMALDGGGGPVEAGDARLVLTSLVPFVHVQPRIRYDTGDVVTVLGWCPDARQLGFRFRGRLASSAVGVVEGRGAVLLSDVDVTEVVDQLPDIACRPHTSERQLWADPDLPRPPFRMGFPRFAVTPPAGRDRRVRVAVETVFEPGAERGRATALRGRLLETLHAELPRLEASLAECSLALDLELVAPGGLRLRTKAAA